MFGIPPLRPAVLPAAAGSTLAPAAPSAEPLRLLGPLVPLSVCCWRFCFSRLCSGEAVGPHSTPACGAVVWEVSSFPSVEGCLPHLVPEEPSFPNFLARKSCGEGRQRREGRASWHRLRAAPGQEQPDQRVQPDGCALQTEGSPAASNCVPSPPSCPEEGEMQILPPASDSWGSRGDPWLE